MAKQTEEEAHALVGLVSGVLIGLTVGIVATVAFGWMRHEPRPPVDVLWKTRTVEVPSPVPAIVNQTDDSVEAGVPVCLEDERAMGVGDYAGSQSGGWEQWRCVHNDDLPAFLGLG